MGTLSEVTDPSLWAEAVGTGNRLPLQQSWAYGAAMASLGLDVTRFLLHVDGIPIGAAQEIGRRLLGPLRLASVIRGPIWFEDADEDGKVLCLGALRRRHRHRSGKFLMVTPEAGAPEGTDRLYRTVGARRVMTGSATVWLDLIRPEEQLMAGLDAKWRNKLRKAEQAGICPEIRRARTRDLHWITDREVRQAEEKGYRGLPARFVLAYAGVAPKDVFLVVADGPGGPVAAALFLRHGPSATYQIGWTTDEGRRLAAQPLLLWRALLALKAEGVRSVDLGGIDTVNAPGIARFKLGLGGDVVHGPGSYF